MSLLGDEKASEKRFKISGKFTGGVGSSGKWNPAAGGRYGNDWEAEARYNKQTASGPTSIGQRLAAAQKKANLGAKSPVRIPGKNTAVADAKSKVVAVAKEAVRKKATSILSPRAQSEAKRLENLFTR